MSPEIEQSQLINRNNPLIKVEQTQIRQLRGGLKTRGLSFQAQTSEARIRSRVCVQADEVQIVWMSFKPGVRLLPSLPSSPYWVYPVCPTNLNMLFISSKYVLCFPTTPLFCQSRPSEFFLDHSYWNNVSSSLYQEQLTTSLLHILPNMDRQTAKFGSFSRMGTLRHMQLVVLF